KGNSETTEDIQLGTSAETKGSTVSFVAKLPSATALYDLSESNSKSVRARIVQGNLLIESDNPAQVNVQIFNTAGQITYDDLFSYDTIINMHPLPKGVYIVKVNEGTKTTNFKIINN
ncbi:MAG: T9SS type A sorting domain-containing protein, partial [Paludibacteraceae bacterium]